MARVPVYILCVILLNVMQGYICLKNVRLKTTRAIKAGGTLSMECDYDLENAQLYSIKWYFENDEFYRFVPKESPPTRVFPVPGISVDLSRSDNRIVILRNVQRDQTGFYKCEVSADAPLFHTDIKSALVVVAEPPDELPSIYTEKLKYPPNEMINAVCTSMRGYPAANLTWYMNGRDKLDGTMAKITSSVHAEEGSLESSKSKLEIVSTPLAGIYIDGKLRLRCEATQFTIYRESTEVEIVDDTPQLAHVLSPTASKGKTDSSSRGTIVAMVLLAWKFGK